MRRVPWSRNDLLIALGAATVDVVVAIAAGRMDGPRATTPGIVLAVLGGLFLLERRRRPLPVLFAVVATQLAFTFTTNDSQGFGAASIVALYQVARDTGTRTMVIGGLAVLGGQLARSAHGTQPFVWSALGDLLGVVFVAATGVGIRKWHQQLLINRQLLADRAVADERRRIARELHDIVAHHITTMYLMSGGARITLDRDPDGARAALMTLEASGRTALREMRQLLGVLRGSDGLDGSEEAPSAPQPGIDELDRLIDESRVAGLPVEFDVIGERRSLLPATELTLYRIVQEALTNTRKHAGSRARATVRLVYASERVEVEVCDDGPGGRRPAGVTGGGYGLLGMRERVAVHGGTLEAGVRPEGGYRIAASVPAPPGENEEEDWAR